MLLAVTFWLSGLFPDGLATEQVGRSTLKVSVWFVKVQRLGLLLRVFSGDVVRAQRWFSVWTCAGSCL